APAGSERETCHDNHGQQRYFCGQCWGLRGVIALCGNPSKLKTGLAELEKARDEALSASQELPGLGAQRDRIAPAWRELEAERTKVREAITAEQNALAAQRHRLAAHEAELEKKAATLAEDRKRHEAHRAAHADRLAELERLRKVFAA